MVVTSQFELEEQILFIDAEDGDYVYSIETFGHAIVVRRDSRAIYEMYVLCKFGSMYHGVIHINNRAVKDGVNDKHIMVSGEASKLMDDILVRCIQFRHLKYIEFEIIRDLFMTVKNLVTDDKRLT